MKKHPITAKENWIKNYPKDMPTEVDIHRYQNLLEFFNTTLSRRPDAVAYINMGEQLTYRSVDERSRAFASYLQNELKLKKGDRVALMLPNLLQYPIAMIGVIRAGMIVVNVNPLYTPRELKSQLQDSGAKAIVVLSNFANTLEQVIDETPIEHVILTKLGDELPKVKGFLVNFVVKHIKKLIPQYHLPHALSFAQCLERGAKMQYIVPEITGDDIAFLQYTGGTTGVAKGAMLTHANLVANTMQICAVAQVVIKNGAGKIGVCALPFYHIFALVANCFAFLELGITGLIITNPRDLPNFIKEMKKYKIAVFSGVNTLFNALAMQPSLKEVDFSALELSIGGGAAIQRKVANRWEAITNSIIVEGYGMTECSPLVSATNPERIEFVSTIGVPVPHTEIRIIKEDGSEADIGERGELWVKGPQVMKGYWQREDETAKVMKDGYLLTGDIVEMDSDYNLHIVDRKKDMIIVSGFNVYPNEIEEIVALHPKVNEVAVIGVPNEHTGESIRVLLTVKDKNLTVDDLKKHCRKYLTGYKVPREFEFTDDLPKSNVGKILRRVVREQYLARLGE